MRSLIPERLRGWWRLRQRRCPECGGKPQICRYEQGCRVCYGWAAKPANKGKVPTPELVENWRERYAVTAYLVAEHARKRKARSKKSSGV